MIVTADDVAVVATDAGRDDAPDSDCSPSEIDRPIQRHLSVVESFGWVRWPPFGSVLRSRVALEESDILVMARVTVVVAVVAVFVVDRNENQP